MGQLRPQRDKLTLDQLTENQQGEVADVFGPDEDMRLFDARRRVSPMLDGNPERMQMTCLLLSLPGTPVLFYGEEIGMGENLSLPGRVSVRTPMQWSRQERRVLHGAAETTATPAPSGRVRSARGECGRSAARLTRC